MSKLQINVAQNPFEKLHKSTHNLAATLQASKSYSVFGSSVAGLFCWSLCLRPLSLSEAEFCLREANLLNRVFFSVVVVVVDDSADSTLVRCLIEKRI